ncbi:hypothetical protein J1614_006015 [Plenodomus biglobosus]|nr:hypothetical protein J1614_006015 [Plenodomus biglobosus]
MISPEGQRAVLQLWAANDTDMVVGPKEEPQAAFARLAAAKGWTEGDTDWCMYWNACFGEDYCRLGEGKKRIPLDVPKAVRLRRAEEWRADNHFLGSTQTTTGMPATLTADNMDDDTSTAAPDLVERMRRLSVSSASSSFSIVSVASSNRSVQSLDSNGSVAGGVQVSQNPELNSTQAGLEKEQETPNVVPLPPAADTKVNVEAGAGDKANVNTEPKPTATACPFWYQFNGFKPSPTAKFKDEFNRLAQHQKWSKTEKRTFQLQALRAEVAFHNGTCIQKLGKWQELCEEMGIEEKLPSITKCRLVSTSPCYTMSQQSG